jgi:hypothetical protein
MSTHMRRRIHKYLSLRPRALCVSLLEPRGSMRLQKRKKKGFMRLQKRKKTKKKAL